VPSIQLEVNSTEVKIKGNNIGNERTGYNVPFDPALEIIAAIIVDDTANPMLESTKVKRNKAKLLITNSSNNAEYNIAITMFIKKTRIKLNNNLPVKTVDGDAINCKVSEVPLSSSETKALARPDIAEKKITTQNKPPVKLSGIFSLPIEKSITLIATIINIARELTA
jgi:hypothetical protein